MITDYRIVQGQPSPGLISSFSKSDVVKGQTATGEVSEQVLTAVAADRSQDTVTFTDRDGRASLQVGFGRDSAGQGVLTVADGSGGYRTEVQVPVEFADRPDNRGYLVPDSLSRTHPEGVSSVLLHQDGPQAVTIQLNGGEPEFFVYRGIIAPAQYYHTAAPATGGLIA